MENEKAKATYDEPKIALILLSDSDIVTASGYGTNTEEGWENLPPQGWV